MKHIAVGQLTQESNGLNPVPTTFADFEAFGWATGSEVMAHYGSVGELEGFPGLSEVQLGRALDVLGVPLPLAAFGDSGQPLQLQGAITAAMFLPHTEINRFPSVEEVWEKQV